jgi:predicted ATPase
MIICTGMDNTGKTTLCNKLKIHYGLELKKSPGPISYPEQKEWMMEQALNSLVSNEEVIYDRFSFMEEMVYGTVLRNGTLFDFNSEVVKAVAATRPQIIYTRPPRKKIFNFGDREQMKGVVDQKEELLNAYDELIFNMISKGWLVHVYDYTEPAALEKLMEKINMTLLLKTKLGGI